MVDHTTTLLALHRNNLKRALFPVYYVMFLLVAVGLFGLLFYLEERDNRVAREHSLDHGTLQLQANLEKTHALGAHLAWMVAPLLTEGRFETILDTLATFLRHHPEVTFARVLDQSGAVQCSTDERDLFGTTGSNRILGAGFTLDPHRQSLVQELQLTGGVLQLGHQLNHLIGAEHRLYVNTLIREGLHTPALFALNYHHASKTVRNKLILKAKDSVDGLTIASLDEVQHLSEEGTIRAAGFSNPFAHRLYLSEAGITTATAGTLPMVTMELIGPTRIPVLPISLALLLILLAGRMVLGTMVERSLARYLPLVQSITPVRALQMRRVERAIFNAAEMRDLPELEDHWGEEQQEEEPTAEPHAQREEQPRSQARKAGY